MINVVNNLKLLLLLISTSATIMDTDKIKQVEKTLQT